MFINNSSLAGIVATDPVFRSNEDVNRNVLTFNLRVKRQGRGADSDFFPVVVFGAYAKTMAELITKGRKLGVVGILRQNRFEQEGVKRERIEVVADHIALGDEAKPAPKANTTLADALAGIDPAALAPLLAALAAAKPAPKAAPVSVEDAFPEQPDSLDFGPPPDEEADFDSIF